MIHAGRPLLNYTIWDYKSRRLVVSWLENGFEIVISNHGESIRTVLDVLRTVRGKRGVEKARNRSDVVLTARDMLTRYRAKPARPPEYLRLVIDNTVRP
jgi:hypothetical protein